MAKKKVPDNAIALNRKARHDYAIEETFEAGLVLEGWEVKSLRASKVQINDTHVLFRHGEAWLFNALITPLATASTHITPNSTRARKLLLNRKEINFLMGRVEAKGYTVVPLKLYWKKNRAKCQIALVKGKKTHDKRSAEKERDWQRQKERIMKSSR